jgi:hypothetical protein
MRGTGNRQERLAMHLGLRTALFTVAVCRHSGNSHTMLRGPCRSDPWVTPLREGAGKQGQGFQSETVLSPENGMGGAVMYP